jgi:hypothetical protein
MNVRTTTDLIIPCALKASMAPIRVGTSAASSARGNNRHEAGTAPPSLPSEKEGSTRTMLGR